ncbi:hypothetical protein BDZ94DRAFT_1257715 [Collybia nuda]|uniref:Uncharacterized protein n=1 Tax=Collybia nuda TaxID=64659 RepID=A0A9P6CKI8_9AGAR|nr:hypothetical protein BDZ94DRAFT_1257715 [Collybia nuda]
MREIPMRRESSPRGESSQTKNPQVHESGEMFEGSLPAKAVKFFVIFKSPGVMCPSRRQTGTRRGAKRTKKILKIPVQDPWSREEPGGRDESINNGYTVVKKNGIGS